MHTVMLQLCRRLRGHYYTVDAILTSPSPHHCGCTTRVQFACVAAAGAVVAGFFLERADKEDREDKAVKMCSQTHPECRSQ